MREAGLTQMEIAVAVGCSLPTVQAALASWVPVLQQEEKVVKARVNADNTITLSFPSVLAGRTAFNVAKRAWQKAGYSVV